MWNGKRRRLVLQVLAPGGAKCGGFMQPNSDDDVEQVNRRPNALPLLPPRALSRPNAVLHGT
jgi:hypothetical protein